MPVVVVAATLAGLLLLVVGGGDGSCWGVVGGGSSYAILRAVRFSILLPSQRWHRHQETQTFAYDCP